MMRKRRRRHGQSVKAHHGLPQRFYSEEQVIGGRGEGGDPATGASGLYSSSRTGREERGGVPSHSKQRFHQLKEKHKRGRANHNRRLLADKKRNRVCSS